MIFNTKIGTFTTFLNKIRVVLRKDIKTAAEYDLVQRSIINYLVQEGFFITPKLAANWRVLNPLAENVNSIQNVLSDKVLEWQIDLYDKYGHRIRRENCVT